MGLPIGTVRYTPVVVAASASYPTVSSFPVSFDLSECDASWWATSPAASDIVVYDPLADAIKPRHICDAFDSIGKTGWLTCDSAMSAAGRTLWICSAPGYGAVNSAAAHTNSGCYSAHGYSATSGNIPDKTGAYIGTAASLTYSKTGIIGNAVGLDASNSRVNFGQVSQISGASSHTFQLLFNRSFVGGSGLWLMRCGTSATDYIAMYFSGTQFTVQIIIGGTSYYTRILDYTQYMQNGVFILMTVIFNGLIATAAQRCRIRINGATIVTTNIGGNPSTLPVITSDSSVGYDSSSLLGAFDESRFFTRDLSDSEDFLTFKNLLDHANFATYGASVVPVSGSKPRPAGHRFGFGF